MKTCKMLAIMTALLVAALLLTACPQATPQVQVVKETVIVEKEVPVEKEVVVVATPAPLGKIIVGTNAEYPPFEYVDETGKIVGFDPDLFDAIAKAAGFEYEFVNTKWDGIFVALASGEFDAVMSAATITDERKQTVDFSAPYFNAGQMITVRADETEITGPEDLPGHYVGVQLGTTGDIAATAIVGNEYMKRYEEITLAMQALANGDVDAVVNDGPTSADIVKANPELNLKMVGSPFTDEFYGIAVRKDRPEVLAAINTGLAIVRGDGTYEAIYEKWFGVPKPKVAEVEPLIIGTTDSVTDLDPANSYDFHTWEIHHNTMDTLLTYIPGTTELQPGLAESYAVSDDGLEYTFTLRKGLKFPDGTPFNADAVVWSINRVMRLEGDPSWLVTSFVDYVEAVDEYTVKFVLQNPVGFFPLVVATPPYSPVSPECYPEDDFDIDSTCGGIGPYLIKSWERDVEMVLEANPDYYGKPPAYPSIVVRYFADSTAMRLALEAGDIDVAWKTLTPSDYQDLEGNPNFNVITGPGAYIRYICFNTTTPPFDDKRVRQAISLAIDRSAISDVVFQGTHQNLYSMVPMGMAGHIDAFGERDLERAKALLAEAGFDASNPLVMDFWWTPDHYGPTEGDVAAMMKQALEETGVIKVNLQSAEWATYTDYFGPGTMPVFLLGWYPDYLDPDNYVWSFAHTDASEDLGIFYSNPDMDALLLQAQTETETDTRLELYKQIQELWTTEVPTIPFIQGKLLVVTRKNVSGVVLDPTMFLHYFTLTK
ncbi:MAG: ABC transporter substrate-binding protein [Anaerolineae bacterium]|nr:ABC transporter substrate-binding protein [Anaerolineae bacterium]